MQNTRDIFARYREGLADWQHAADAALLANERYLAVVAVGLAEIQSAPPSLILEVSRIVEGRQEAARLEAIAAELRWAAARETALLLKREVDAVEAVFAPITQRIIDAAPWN